MNELFHRDATALASLIASGEVSSVEVVQAHLDRIEAVNPALNAVTEVLTEAALVAAAEADRATTTGGPIGPLHGVPITVKQNIDLAGSATTWGLPALAGSMATLDSPVVERMRAAGAIPIARTNCPDLGLRVHTDSFLNGLTRTPWTPHLTAGGSSGGEAVALASGMSPLGLGNDIGGSLRNPATCNGIASIKPSAGRVPVHTSVPSPDGPPSFQAMVAEGPMARRVGDVRLALSILEGRHLRDPFSQHAPPGPVPRDRPVRVVVAADPPGGATDPGVAGRIEAAGAALVDAGYEVIDTEPPRFAEIVEAWATFLVTDIRLMAPTIEPLMGPDATRFLGYMMDAVRPVDLAGYTALMSQRQSIMREWAQWLAEVDLLLTPVWTQPPFEHGFDASSVANAAATIELIRCVTVGNFLGLPAAVASAGMVGEVPVGAMVTAGYMDDHSALDAAEVIEAALGVLLPIDPRW